MRWGVGGVAGTCCRLPVCDCFCRPTCVCPLLLTCRFTTGRRPVPHPAGSPMLSPAEAEPTSSSSASPTDSAATAPDAAGRKRSRVQDKRQPWEVRQARRALIDEAVPGGAVHQQQNEQAAWLDRRGMRAAKFHR